MKHAKQLTLENRIAKKKKKWKLNKKKKNTIKQLLSLVIMYNRKNVYLLLLIATCSVSKVFKHILS